jgi:hypothetical protein
MADSRFWPGLLGEVYDFAGAEAAMSLAAKYGGLKVSVPAEPTADSPLAQCVGLEVARWLGEHYGAESLRVPLGPRDRTRQIEALVADGWTTADIVRRLGVADRTVARARERLAKGRGPLTAPPARRVDARQLSILDFVED